MGYDAFISYSHAADDQLAPRLQEGLQRFGKPWYRRRELSVFRDRTGLSANPGLWSSIVEALDESEWFILLASPESASSSWVNREVEHWRSARGTEQLLVVLTDGTWIWDEQAGGFDPASTAVPAALVGAFAEEPYHLDLSWASGEAHADPRDGRFRDAVATLAAAIHHVPKDELVGADVREHRRTLRMAWAAAALLIALTLFSGTAAVAAARNADQVREEQEQTESARADADHQAALAVDAAAQAQANAGEAQANAQRARANADEAQANAEDAAAQRSEAESNAAEADANADEAERNASDAQANAAKADANAGRAQRSESLAEANASEAQAAEARALDSAAVADTQRNHALQSEAAARAAEQEAAANAANAEHQRQLAEAANASLTHVNIELADQQAILQETNEALSSSNAALGEANQALNEQNAELESSRLTALSTQAHGRGMLDLAMLLTVEAHRADPSNPAARDALAGIEADSGYLDQYLPGDGIVARWTPMVQGNTLVAGYGDSLLQPLRFVVWDLERPNDPPLRIDPTNGGTESVQIWDAFLLGGGRRLAAPVQRADFSTSWVVWDVETGTELFRSAPSINSPTPASSPSGDTLLVTEGSQVVLVDALTGTRTASWEGSLSASASTLAGCRGPQSGPTTVAEQSPTACDWSPDGRRVLGWSSGHAAWVLWSLDDPASEVVIGGPPEVPPHFLPGSTLRIAVALAPGTVSLVDGAGAPVATYAVPAVGGVVTLGTANDRVAVADATGGVWSIDTSSGEVSDRREVDTLCGTVDAVRYSEARHYVLVISSCDGVFPQYAYVPVSEGEADVRPTGVAPISFVDDDRQVAESIGRGLQVRDLDGGPPQSFGNIDCRVHIAGSVFVCEDGFVINSPFGWVTVALTSAPITFTTTGDAPLASVAVMPGGRVATFDLFRSPVGTTAPLTDLPGWDAVLAPDGNRFAISRDGTITIVDRATGAQRSIDGFYTYAVPVFTPDSRRLLVAGFDVPVTVLDASDGTRVGDLGSLVEASPDGDVFATWEPDGTQIELRSAEDLSPLGAIDLAGRHPRSVAVGPDGEWLALIDGNDLVVVEAASGKVVATIVGRFPGALTDEGMTVSPDGSRLVVTSYDSPALGVSLWDTATWTELANEPAAASPDCAEFNAQETGKVQFSPHGDLLVVHGQILAVDGLTPVGSQVGCSFLAGDRFRSAAFGSDGSSIELLVERPGLFPDNVFTVATVSLDSSTLADASCAVAGRNLTVTERSRYLAGADAITCDRWPHP